jgi:hypothetical protein
MERLLLIVSFLITGFLPLGLGVYLANRGDYVISVGCFLISVCGFQQVYHSLKKQEMFETFKAGQEKELENQQEDYAKQKKQLTQNLAEQFGKRFQEQQEKVEYHRKMLSKTEKILDQRNKEIWQLKNQY